MKMKTKNFKPLNYYIGLMSGTSCDGIDGVIVDFEAATPRTLMRLHHSFPEQLKATLKQIITEQACTLNDWGNTHTALGECYADLVHDLLKEASLFPRDILAIGNHGQTLCHQPNGESPFTLQIGNHAVLAARTGIPVIGDFRSMDMAYGGQGAPLAPIFHQAFLATPGETTAIVNIGGIANVTVLNDTKSLAAFDTGPGNTLMDTWMQTHRQQEYDQNGDLARTGKVLPKLLATWLNDPYFAKPFPKSTGREYFSALLSSCDHEAGHRIPGNINTLTTLTELTAQSISHALAPFKPKQILICGGGALNAYLMERLHNLNPQAHLGSVAEQGFDPQEIEALAFAYLAKLRFENTALDLREITGSNSPASLLGVVYYPDSRR